MATRFQFIPGRPCAPHSPLARYRPVQPVEAVGSYVRRLSRPGDLVVDLFCQGPTVIREAVAEGRRALGVSVNPVLLTASRLGLIRRDADALNSAFTRLADSPKGDVPLHRYLTSLYRSSCPTCDAEGVAVWFAWDRDGNYPFRKAVRCPKCEELQEGASDDRDVQVARRIQPRGLAFYYALDRVAPPDHPARERAAGLVELYTPRNLAVLMDLVRRLEGLAVDEDVRLWLTGVLLDCFDLGSRLDPYDEARPRPRTLRVPSRYLERNVWTCFEEGFSRFLAQETTLPVQPASDVAALVKGEEEGYALVSHATREVRKTIPAGSAALIFADPPRPDGVFWALSALWAGWLWESAPARALRPYLRRRRFDWDWHWNALRAALQAAGPLLVPGGRLITLFSDSPQRSDALLESVCLATGGAGYGLDGWGYAPEVGYRLIWSWKGVPSAAPASAEKVERNLITEARGSAVTTLRERSEPTAWTLLRSSAYARLVERDLLVRAAGIQEGKDAPRTFVFVEDVVRRALEAAPLSRLSDGEEGQEGGEDLWWWADLIQAEESITAPPTLPTRDHAKPPLADRVEAVVWELLVQRPAWEPQELVETVYARFPGPLTPELTLVLTCVDSYSVQEGETLRLRPEDDPPRRAAEMRALCDDLVRLGKRLGFEVQREDGWDVCWLSEGQDAYLFDVSATVALGPYLLTLPSSYREGGEGVQRCLVVPGGRAGLISLKLQRDPRLARAVERYGWQFVKFRHLRRLLAKEDLDRYALKTVLGLDPIVEQEAAQIPLL